MMVVDNVVWTFGRELDASLYFLSRIAYINNVTNLSCRCLVIIFTIVVYLEPHIIGFVVVVVRSIITSFIPGITISKN